MTRKKRIQDVQPKVIEITPVKKTVSKRVKLKIEDAEPLQTESELPTLLEDIDFSLKNDDSILAKDYSIEDILGILEEENESINNEEKTASDDILEKFDKDLESKGLGDDYFQKKEEQLKEMELEHEIHEFTIDEMLSEED